MDIIGGGDHSGGLCSETKRHRGKPRVEMKHPGSEALYHFWSALRAGRSAPYKAEVTAQGLGRTLSAHVFMLEALTGGELRFRLGGSALHDLFGMELRGMSALSVMEGESRARFADLAQEVLASGVVGVLSGEAVAADGEAVGIEIVLAPLRSDFGRMDRLLGAVHTLDGARDIAPAARRCRLSEGSIRGHAAPEAPAAALPGFAEAPAGFAGKKPELRVAGGASTPAPRRGVRRRDHLRVVKG